MKGCGRHLFQGSILQAVLRNRKVTKNLSLEIRCKARFRNRGLWV